MKKKTKSRLKNDLAVPFRIAVFICLICAAVSYWLFHQSFFRALSKMGEEPIATITFKYKTAERKFLERVVWDRLRQNSPVYNGDTIHTADLSEATVWFVDGTTLDLAENTMAQIFLHGDGLLAADLEKGSLTVDSAEESKGVILTSQKVQVSVQAGSSLSATKSEENSVTLSLKKGTAEFENGESVAAGESVVVADGIKSKPALTVLSPLPNEKFLYYDEEPLAVDFSWAMNLQDIGLRLQISQDKNFKHLVQNIDASGLDKLSVKLSRGVYYWRISETEKKGQKETGLFTGKFQIIQSLKPELIVPVNDFTYTYRRQTPSVRFIWRESEAATAYNFVVSKNPDMSSPVIEKRSSSPSIIISTLGKGTWYYQVTPYYVVNRTGLANPSQVGSFKIEQRGELLTPLLVAPVNGAFINKTRKSETLSWRMDEEFVTYNVVVSANKNLTSPVISRETIENYISLSQDELKKLKDGEYFWAVTQTDSEGNVSPRSEVYSFYAATGEIEQRTVFPPDNYKIWQPLLGDIRFTWKSNLNLTQYFQVASDKDFTDIKFEAESTGSSYYGTHLDYGEYYWRITTKDENFKMSTSAKKLSVVDELYAPAVEFPSASKKAVVRPEEPCLFSWKDSEGADYYRIRLYRSGSSEVIYDENFITDTTVEVDVKDFEEGRYRWEIQAFTSETELTSRRSSQLAGTDFTLRKIRPIVLASPKNGAVIGGWEAIENPPVLQWNSREPYVSAQVVLTKKSGLEAEEKVYIKNNFSQQLPPLSSGIYEWTVMASSLDEFDISAMNKYSFTVEEIPPFPVPEKARTAKTSYFNGSYLRKTPYIVFEWDKVPRAQGYVIEIMDKKNKTVFRKIIDDAEAKSYKYENLVNLSKGDFTWKVRGVVLTDDKKEILIDGIPAENKFTIDYAINSAGGKRKKKGELYAQ